MTFTTIQTATSYKKQLYTFQLTLTLWQIELYRKIFFFSLSIQLRESISIKKKHKDLYVYKWFYKLFILLLCIWNLPNHRSHHKIRAYMHALDSLMHYQFPATCKHTPAVILNGDKWPWSWSSDKKCAAVIWTCWGNSYRNNVR